MSDSSQLGTSTNPLPRGRHDSGRDSGRDSAQPAKNLTRGPWTSTSGQLADGQSEDVSSPFAVRAGLAPGEIPGFPFFNEEDGDEQPVPAHAQAAPVQSNAAIRPLPRLATKPATTQAAQTAQAPQMVLPQMQAAPQRPQAQSRTAAAQPSTTTGRLNLSMLPGLSGTVSDHLSTGYLDPMDVMFAEPRSLQETGINQGLIADLVLKTMYFTSYMSGQEISSALRLPFYGVLDQIIGLLKKEQLCEVSGTAGLGEGGYQYVLTIKGMERAHQVLVRSKYVGPAPVPLGRYIEAIRAQTSRRPTINRDIVEQALRGMVMGDELKDQVGAAVNAGKSLFLFGAPGNGKTMLAERIATMLGGHVAIPYALEADGQIIQLFDLNSHRPVVPSGASDMDSTKAELPDRRWVRIHRPVVVVGGELTMASLDLIYNESVGFYEAPFQLKANGGLFLIDDFGRQQVSPQALLNRWIVPLEKAIDFLTLKTGKKLQVPFELFLVLSTNLQPEDLIDDAFLRRIQNKLNVPDPTPQQFYEIFVAQCKTMNVPFDQQGFIHLVNKHYKETRRPFRASQPRDLLRQLIGIARYRSEPPEMTRQLLDAACGTYFVNSKK